MTFTLDDTGMVSVDGLPIYYRSMGRWENVYQANPLASVMAVIMGGDIDALLK